MEERRPGSLLAGVDLSLEGPGQDEAAAAAQFERIQRAVELHGFVVLPAQPPSLTRQQLHKFAMRWGPIALHIGQGPNEYPGLPGMLTINDGNQRQPPSPQPPPCRWLLPPADDGAPRLFAGFSEDAPAPEPGATEFGPSWHCDFAACVRPGYATILK